MVPPLQHNPAHPLDLHRDSDMARAKNAKSKSPLHPMAPPPEVEVQPLGEGFWQPLAPRDANKENMFAEPVDPMEATASESVKSVVNKRHFHQHKGRLLTPPEFKLPAPTLRTLRAHKVWAGKDLDAQVKQMAAWFPDLPPRHNRSVATPSLITEVEMTQHPSTPLEKLIDHGAMDIDQAPARASASGVSISDMGDLALLPGELRNRIYRYALLEDDLKVAITSKGSNCGQGRCTHSTVAGCAPGLASTCRQIRWEVMPIWVVENRVFEFDADMVRNSCVGNFLRILGPYSDLIHHVTLQIKRPIWHGISWTGVQGSQYMYDAIYRFELARLPRSTADGDKLRLKQTAPATAKAICHCKLRKVMSGVNKNHGHEPMGIRMEQVVDHEDFVDFVYRCVKTKMLAQRLVRCEVCNKKVLER